MWWLNLILALTIVIYCVLVVVAYGIRIALRADFDNLSVCLKCYIFDWIEMFCVKIFVCQGKFYYQINKKRLKTIENTNDEECEKDEHKPNKKLKLGAYISKLWSKKPSIVLRSLNINYSTALDDAKDRALLDGAVAVISNSLIATNSGKLKIQNYHLENICDKTKFSGVELECVVGLTIFKLALFGLYATLVKPKYKVAV